MEKELLESLKVITKEEQNCLDGDVDVQKEIYTSKREFVIDSNKMLKRGELIDVRTHTRFVHFPKHRHNYIEIIYMCSGSTIHIINDNCKVELEKGDLLFLNQNAYQEILPAGENDIAINFIVLPEFFDETFSMMQEGNVLKDFLVGSLKQPKQAGDYIHFEVADILPIQNLIENMVWSIMNKQGNERHINQTTMGLLFLQLLNYIDRIDRNNPNQYEKNLMFTVLSYIEEHYKDGTLTELAKKTNQSLTWISWFIKNQTGSTFKELIKQKKLNRAVSLLLTTGLTIEEIILAVGYVNSSYFHRIFREKYGMTPKKYRDENKK